MEPDKRAELSKEKIDLEYAKLDAQKENSHRDHEIELRKLDLERDKLELEREKLKKEEKKVMKELISKIVTTILALLANVALAFFILTFEHWMPTKIFNWIKPVCL